ncbi:hypothetical protein [Nitrospirillum sp. BR 11163]|nr:hypothetical protein [Nitrospirillum sp. BR 11163]MEA1674368.1 hypothetical protein [Nitrospirillum sp. BR 11163]
MRTWKARVKVGNNSIEVRIQANNYLDAKNLLEAQYGKGNIAFNPVEIK